MPDQPTTPDTPTAPILPPPGTRHATPADAAEPPASDLGAMTSSSASEPRMFCPYGGLVGSKESQWSRRTAGLLHKRLRALGLLIVVAMGIGQARDLFISLGFSLNFPRVVFVLMVAAVAYLYWEKNPPLVKLRIFEVFVIAAPIAVLLYLDRNLILQSAEIPDPSLALMNWWRTMLHMAALIAGYAMFIPAGWKRTLIVTTPMAMAPLALGLVMINTQPAVAAAAQQALTTEIWSAGLLMMGVLVAIATYGTYIIDTIRHEQADIGFAGQYQLVKKIGQGGMGEVWQARHNLLTRRAAIKVIRPEMLKNGGGPKDTVSVSTAMKRFEREAQATANLTSPHTISVYDFGTALDGSFYYVMQYLDGLDLDTLVEEYGPVPVERAVHLVVQACESLAEAHESGLIHRDVKPANIFSTRLGITHDFVKVLDFGLVKDTEVDAEAATRLTQEGMTSGTPAYMPPEIALAKPDVDARADIYALGCVAYWLLTGQHVFASGSPVEMIVDHVKTEPPAPSTRTEISVPPELDDAILRSLAKDPDVRFQSMREFAKALRGVPLSKPWTDERAEEWWRLHGATGAAGVSEAA